MRVAKLAAILALVTGTIACGEGTFYAANRPTPGGQSNAQGGRRGMGFGVTTVRQELDSRGVICGEPARGTHQVGPVLYQKDCRK